MIDLHYVRTPNGLKISIMLEEVELPYRIIDYDMFAGEHLKPQFKKINPNHKLPAIVDLEPEDRGEPFPVFESGAILLYLAKKSGRLLPSEFRSQFVALQWLTWQVAGLGPMIGQAAHFVRYAPEGQAYGIDRYKRETRRLLNVLDGRLSEAEYLRRIFDRRYRLLALGSEYRKLRHELARVSVDISLDRSDQIASRCHIGNAVTDHGRSAGLCEAANDAYPGAMVEHVW